MGEPLDEAKGRAKEAMGDLTDDEKLQREGKLDQAGAEAKEWVETGKEKVGDLMDRIDEGKDR